ncbi:MAG: MFS transporter, partial [Endomicrobium sp.]|nr:MFS transporter [Endomicrobium sp.]
FLNYIKLKEESGHLDEKKAKNQFSQLQKHAASVLNYGDYTELSSALLEDDKIRSAAKIYKIVSQKIPNSAKLFPHALKFLEISFLKSELNEYKAHIQKAHLLKYIVENHVPEAEKEIFFLTSAFSALKNIYTLEISRDELLDFINYRAKLKSAASRYLDIAECNTLSHLAENDVTDLICKNNLNRDEAFFKSVKNIITPYMQKKPNDKEIMPGINSFKKVYVVVAGGFHREFYSFLKSNKISFITLLPKSDISDSGNFQKSRYLDALKIPGKLGTKNYYSYARSAFAPPLLNILNSKADNDMKETMLKNIINAWVESAAEYSVSKEEIYAEIYMWLKNNGFSDADILQYASLKQVMPASLQNAQKDDKTKLPEIKTKKLNVLLHKIKDFFSFAKAWSFPDTAVAFSYMSKAVSYEAFAQLAAQAKKNKARRFEFSVKKNGRGFYFELDNGLMISFKEALKTIKESSKKKETNEIIIKLDGQMQAHARELEEIINSSGNTFTLITPDKNFLKNRGAMNKKTKFVCDISASLQNGDNAEALFEIAELDIDGIYVDGETFRRNAAYLAGSGLKKNEIFTQPEEKSGYGDFIFKNKNKIALLCKDFDGYSDQKKEIKAAYRNVSAVPLMQLVVGFEFFASFSTIYLQNSGYSLSFLGLFLAISGPLSIAGSIAAGFLSKRFGQRNVLIVNLLLHCIGDSFLLIAGISPLFLALGLGVPAMAAAIISALLIPFLHSSLEISGKGDKFESAYGKTRSLFWIGLALSSVAGSWLVQFIGYSGVIALSCAIITGLTFYSLFNTSSLKKHTNIQDDASVNEFKKIKNALKTVFKKKEIKSIVLMNFVVDTLMFVFLALAAQTMLIKSGLNVAWLGVIMFSANIAQSLASKIANKAASLINNSFKRTIYFSFLAASAAAFMVFNNPFILIIFYLLANFWQGISSVIEPAKIEKHISDDVTPYWFSVRTIIVSLMATGMQLLMCLLIDITSLNGILLVIAGIVTGASALLGAVYKNNGDNGGNKRILKDLLSKFYKNINNFRLMKAPNFMTKNGFKTAVFAIMLSLFPSGSATATFDKGNSEKELSAEVLPLPKHDTPPADSSTISYFEALDSINAPQTEIHNSAAAAENAAETASAVESADSIQQDSLSVDLTAPEVMEEATIKTDSIAATAVEQDSLNINLPAIAAVEAGDSIQQDSLNIDLSAPEVMEEATIETDSIAATAVEQDSLNNLTAPAAAAAGTDIPITQVLNFSEKIQELLISYPQIQNLAGLGEVLAQQYGSETALNALKYLGQSTDRIYTIKEILYLINTINIKNGFTNILTDKIPLASALSCVNAVSSVAEIDGARKAALDLKEQLNYELPSGEIWKDKLPENNDNLLALLAGCGNDSKAAFDRIVFAQIYDKNAIAQYLPENFSLSKGLRAKIFDSFNSMKKDHPDISFENYLNSGFKIYLKDILIDALKQYKTAKKPRAYDYTQIAKNAAALPAALSSYSSVTEISIDKPIEAGSETSVYLPYISAVNKDASPEKKIAAQIKNLRGAYSAEELKNLITGLNEIKDEPAFYSQNDEKNAVKAAHKILAAVTLEEAARDSLNVEQISDGLEKYIIKKDYSKDAEIKSWAALAMSKYKSDIYIDALKKHLQEKHADGKNQLNSADYFAVLDKLLSNFKGFEIKFYYYSIEEAQKIFKEARGLKAKKESLIGADDLKALKSAAKKTLGSANKYLPKDSVLLSALKDNNFDLQKTIYVVLENTFFIEPAVSKDGAISGWSWGLKETGKNIAWGKKPAKNAKLNIQDKNNYSKIIADSVMLNISQYLPRDFKMSKNLLFSATYDFCASVGKEPVSIYDKQKLVKYASLIFADALLQETQKYKNDKDSYDISVIEKILEGAALTQDNKEAGEFYANVSDKIKESLIKDSIIDQTLQIKSPAYFALITQNVLNSLEMPQEFKISKEAQADVNAYLESNKDMSEKDLENKLKEEYEKTFFLDALMQYKSSKKPNGADWSAFAASLLPKVAFVSAKDAQKTFTLSGSSLLEIAVPGMPAAANGFEIAASLAFLSGNYGAPQKIAQAFARTHYASSDSVRNSLIERYYASKSGKVYVYSVQEQEKLFEWINSKEKDLFKNELRLSVQREYGAYGINKLSVRLEKKILQDYRFSPNSPRQDAVKEIRVAYANDIELNVLSELVSRIKRQTRQNGSLQDGDQNEEYAATSPSKNKTIQELAQDEKDFAQLMSLAEKLGKEGNTFKYYGTKYVNSILVQANKLIAEKEQSGAKINSITLKVLSGVLS